MSKQEDKGFGHIESQVNCRRITLEKLLEWESDPQNIRRFVIKYISINIYRAASRGRPWRDTRGWQTGLSLGSVRSNAGKTAAQRGKGGTKPPFHHRTCLGMDKVLKARDFWGERVKEQEWFEQRVGNGNKIPEVGETILVCLINMV